ncbi:hypothetical protein CA236_14245 [Sphingomonas sp. ABOLG]|uniref:Uncharacterized protein n=1 Tax=Sphingomonas olei TaxID=1886787 RepID=A0ABY2QDM6_9SPHN|nr:MULTISPECIES: hypothetical protein [Sphingomonas]KKI18136.1 hypothetical protein XM50_18580 [Sphingomonas sp. Ag1]MDF2602727.1 hypothetical protein [Sphingomonas sp.]RSV15535.1 hypothetical protein CA236_14245 [Sphingomonas sp. ABOLG]THG37823.1 hypothetical protein E5988_15440 [Sphingomonas olei]
MSDEPNEILAAAAAAKQHETAAKDAKAARQKRGWDLGKIGLGVGIGSAAIAAAVLFTRKKD